MKSCFGNQIKIILLSSISDGIVSIYPSFIKPTISLSEKSEKVGIPNNQMDDVPFIKFIQIFICIIIFLCFFKIYLEIELYLKISFNQSVILRRKAACIVIWRGLNIFKKWFISFSKKIIQYYFTIWKSKYYHLFCNHEVNFQMNKK